MSIPQQYSAVPSSNKLSEGISVSTQSDGARSTSADEPGCVHELFEAQAELRPKMVAVWYEDQRITYEDLNGQANRIAHYLRRLGVRSEMRVALLLDRSLEIVAAMLGVLKAGAAYVPVEPDLPVARLAQIVEGSHAALLLTCRHLRSRLPATLIPVITLDDDEHEIEQQSAENPRSAGLGKSLAYVIFTSGSTGSPKGVAVEHRQLLNYVTGIGSRLDVKAGASMALVSTFSADLGHTMLFSSLCLGGELHVISEERSLDGQLLARYFRQHRPAYLKLTPSHFRALFNRGGVEVLPGDTLVLGGEAWTSELVRQAESRCRVVNHYGPTECTVGALVGELPETDMRNNAELIPLGTPLPNVRVYALDSEMQPVAVNMHGELYIGGSGVARGYLGQPALTAASFLPDPFGSYGGRLYRTGDVVRCRSNGILEFVGRIDDQVKIRGHRVEPGEVESALLQHSNIQQAVVVSRECEGSGRELIGYIVPKDKTLDIDQVRHFLQAKVPAYVIPATFVTLEAIPLTKNGKVDRGRLPPPKAAPSVVVVEDGDSTETQIRDIWVALLNRNDVRRHDNFFSLGGHSLMAVSLAARLSQLFATNVQVRSIFEKPTISELAEALRAKTIPGASSSPSVIAIRSQGRKPPFFAVHPSGGMVRCYESLARHLSSDQPFYAFQSRGLDNEDQPLTSVEEMAALYISEMRMIQRSGPYFIGGWSLGGLVAYEMAQKLREVGEKTGQLVLFDSRPRLQKRISSYHAEVSRSEENEFLDRLLAHREFPIQTTHFLSFEEKMGLAFQKSEMPTITDMTRFRAMVRVSILNERSAINYLARPYDGPLVLFRTSLPIRTDSLDPQPDSRPAYGWEQLVKKITVYPFAEPHATFLGDANARHLAETLTAVLEGV